MGNDCTVRHRMGVDPLYLDSFLIFFLLLRLVFLQKILFEGNTGYIGKNMPDVSPDEWESKPDSTIFRVFDS